MLDLGRLDGVSIGSLGEVQAIACRNVYYWKSSRTLKLVTPDKTYSVLMSGIVKNREQLWSDYGTTVKVVVQYMDQSYGKTYMLDAPFYFGTKQTFTKQDGSSFTGIGLVSEYTMAISPNRSEHASYSLFDYPEKTNPDSYRRGGGNNRWMHSNLRQWLNKSGTNWYTAQHEYDAASETLNKMYAFLSCVPPSFSDACIPVKMLTKTATVDGGGYDTTYDKFFALSLSQINCKCTDKSVATGDESEGRYWEYWRNKTGSSDYITGYSGVDFGTSPGRKIEHIYEFLGYPRIQWWLRSAYLNTSYIVFFVGVNGDVNWRPAESAISGFLPACVIG